MRVVNNGYSLFAEEVTPLTQYVEEFIKFLKFSPVAALSRF